MWLVGTIIYRCQCLQIEGIVKPHKRKDGKCYKSCWKMFAEVNVYIPDIALDRSQRIGPVYKDDSDQSVQGIIIKFNKFWYRSVFYKNQKKIKSGKHVWIDLTGSNCDLLKKQALFEIVLLSWLDCWVFCLWNSCIYLDFCPIFFFFYHLW